MKKFAGEVGLPLADQTHTKRKTGPKVDKEPNENVMNFYGNDDISWQAPGRKDRVIINRSKYEHGEKHKEYVQCRYAGVC